MLETVGLPWAVRVGRVGRSDVVSAASPESSVKLHVNVDVIQGVSVVFCAIFSQNIRRCICIS